MSPALVLVPSTTGAGGQLNQHVYAAISGVPLAQVRRAGAQGDAARAAVRSHLLQRPAGDGGARPARVVHPRGRARPTRRRQHQRHMAIGRRGPTRSEHGPLRGRARLPGEEPRPRQPPLGYGSERAQLDEDHARSRTARCTARSIGIWPPRASATRFASWAATSSRPTSASGSSTWLPTWPICSTHTRCTSTGTTGTRPSSSDGSRTSRTSCSGSRRAAGSRRSSPSSAFAASAAPRCRRRAPTPTARRVGQTRIAAFQHAWFQIVATQLGFVGTVKWDCYSGKYDRGTQAYYVIGPWQSQWPLYPTYHALRLLTGTTEPGWKVVAVQRRAPSARTKQLTAFTGPSQELTILGLDTARQHAERRLADPGHLRDRRTAAPGPRSPSSSGIDRATGRTRSSPRSRQTKRGLATVAVPLHAVFALTTMPVSLL